MKTIDSYQALCEILSTQNSCTFTDLAEFKTNKERENPEIYVDVTKKSVLATIGQNPDLFYWENTKRVIHKQETIKCFICEEKHRMFPNVQKFLKIKEMMENVKNKL